MKARFATKYPKLFDCYWGGFEICGDTENDEIIQNRNAFVEEFGIVSSVHYKTLSECFSQQYCDHPETYRCQDGRVIFVCSNYGTKPPDRFELKLYKQLYSTETQTYIRVFESSRDIPRRMK